MRRSLTTIIALSMVCQAAFAAGSQDGGAESRTLRIASWGVQEAATAPYFELLKEQFEEANPGVTVEYIGYPYGQLKQQVLVMASAGEAPDIVQSERSWFPGFVSSGYFAPLDDYVTPAWADDMFSAIRADLTIDGELWAAPWFYSPFVMFYNTDLFRRAGLDPDDPPSTYAEALEAARVLSNLTDETGNPVFGLGITSGSVPVSGSALLSMFMSFGGGITDGAGNVVVDTRENLAALTYLQTLYEENINPPAALLKDLRNLFAIGRLGMYFDQFWGIGGAFGINSAIRLQTAVREPLDSALGEAGSTLEAHLLMVSADSPNKELAGEFIRFATTRDQLATYFVATPFLPPYASAAEDGVFLDDALAGSVGDAQDSIRAVPAHPEMENVYLSLTEAAQRVTVGGEEPAAVLTGLAASIEALLAR